VVEKEEREGIITLKKGGKVEKYVEVTIKGISPLLMNRPDMLEFQDKAKKKQAGVDILEKQFETKQYKTSDGELFTPDTHIKGTMMEAGKTFKVSSKGKATYSKIVGYGVVIKPAQIIHKMQELEKHIVLAVNPSTKGRNPVCRPMLPTWELDFTIEYDADEIPFGTLKEILDYAGRKIGIGDWRPAKKGTFGKFIVTRFIDTAE